MELNIVGLLVLVIYDSNNVIVINDNNKNVDGFRHRSRVHSWWLKVGDLGHQLCIVKVFPV